MRNSNSINELRAFFVFFGITKYGFRYLDPVAGRWASSDLIEEQGGVNLHNFVANNSINIIDSLGNYYELYTGTRSASSYNSTFGSVDNEGGWPGALYDLKDWLSGNTPSTTDYPPGDPKTIAVSKSPIGRNLVSKYLKKFKNETCVNWGDYTNSILEFGVNEFIASIPNGRAHFVGSARGDGYSDQFFPNECKVKVKFVVTNTTSLKSALYHSIPDSWNITTTGRPAANWTQTYTWFETFDCKNRL